MSKIKKNLDKRGDSKNEEIIGKFARAHMTLTQSLIARWPDITQKERVNETSAWYKEFCKYLDPIYKKWFNGKESPELQASFIRRSIDESIGSFLGECTRNTNGVDKFHKEKLSSRGDQIIEVLRNNVDIKLLTVNDKIFEIGHGPVMWGQHGAHFPLVHPGVPQLKVKRFLWFKWFKRMK